MNEKYNWRVIIFETKCYMIKDSEKFNQGHTYIINMIIPIQIFVDE